MLKNFMLYIEKDYQAMSKRAADLFAGSVRKNPKAAFGFATGSTPSGMYKNLVEMQKAGKFDMRNIKAFNLDEYYPIKADDPQSYAYYMRKNLFDQVHLPAENTFIPSGEATDPIAECDAYEEKLSDAGIEMQILGIGNNGHIAFIEPAPALASTTSYSPLAEETIKANSRFFASPDDVPRHSLTVGMHSIMMARRILLLASGSSKAEAISATLNGNITTMVPASLLQLHRDVIVVLDYAAAQLL